MVMQNKGGGGAWRNRSPSPAGMMWILVERGARGADAGQGALAKQFTAHEAPDGRGLTSGELEISGQRFRLELRRRQGRDLS